VSARLAAAPAAGARRARLSAPVAVFALAMLLLLVADALVRDEPKPRGDDQIYELMARHPFATHTFPFAYRVAIPTIVHVLPFSDAFSFSLLAWVCSGAAAAFLYLIMVELGLDELPAAGVAVVFAVSPGLLIASLRQGRNPDPSTVLVMSAGLYFILRRQLVPLAVTLFLGAFVRESVLFLAPAAYAVWARRLWDRDAARDTVLVSVAMVVAYVCIRLAIPTVGRDQVRGYSSPIGDRWHVLKAALHNPFTQARRTFVIYGPLWVLAPMALQWSSLARRLLVLIACVLLAMTFALDWPRMVLMAVPAFYAASALTLRRYPRLVTPTIGLLVVIAVAYGVYMQHSGVRTGIIDNPLPPYPVR
jgi:hypothetical protein